MNLGGDRRRRTGGGLTDRNELLNLRFKGVAII